MNFEQAETIERGNFAPHLESASFKGAAARGHLATLLPFRRWFVSEVQRVGLEDAKLAAANLIGAMAALPAASLNTPGGEAVPKFIELICASQFLKQVNDTTLRIVAKEAEVVMVIDPAEMQAPR